MNILKNYLADRADIKKILSNTIWLFSDRIVRMVLTVTVSAWVARYLGTEGYGQLNLALAYVALAAPVAKLGLDQIVVKHLVDDCAEKIGDILGTAFWMRLVAALLLLPVLVWVVGLLHPDQDIIVLLTVLIGIGMVFQSLEIIDLWFQSQVESKNTVISRNISFGVITALRVVAILLSGSVLIFGFLHLLYIIFSTILLGSVYVQYGRHNWRVNWQYVKNFLRASAPLIIAGLAVLVYMRIDQVMLGQLLPAGEAERVVGVYAAAVRVSELWYFVPAAVISSVFPALITTREKSQSLYLKRLQRLFKLIVLIAYCFAIPLTFLSETIIAILFGSEYAEAAPILVILAWSGVWAALDIARSQVLVLEQLTRSAMWATIAGAVVNVILNLLLIPTSGALGCAIATFVSYGISGYLSSYFFNISFPLGNMQTIALFLPNPFTKV